VDEWLEIVLARSRPAPDCHRGSSKPPGSISIAKAWIVESGAATSRGSGIRGRGILGGGVVGGEANKLCSRCG